MLKSYLLVTLLAGAPLLSGPYNVECWSGGRVIYAVRNAHSANFVRQEALRGDRGGYLHVVNANGEITQISGTCIVDTSRDEKEE